MLQNWNKTITFGVFCNTMKQSTTTSDKKEVCKSFILFLPSTDYIAIRKEQNILGIEGIILVCQTWQYVFFKRETYVHMNK